MRNARRSMRAAVIAVALFVALTLGCSKRESPSGGRYEGAPVIIISIDTLRSDRLPAYGYDGVSTPAIDALRNDSILFESAYAQVPLTLPSHVSFLTGTLPAQNGMRNNIGYRVDPAVPSLPKTLESAGYATGAAVSSYVLRGATGIGAWFGEYDDFIVAKPGEALGSLQRPGAESAAAAVRFIEQNREKSFFYLLHLFEPHAPYSAPEPFRSRYANAYDAEIAASDEIVGKFVEELKRLGVYDRALVILLSDHGEGLGDHGEPEHGLFVYREAIQVPLMVKLPGSKRGGEKSAAPVALLDIFPTVTDILGLEAPDGLIGRSLFSAEPNRNVYSETFYPRIHFGWSELRSLIGPEFHFIEAPRPELYAHRKDPGERANVLADQRRTYAALRKELEGYPKELAAPAAVDPEEAAKLAALGYLGASAPAISGPTPDPKDGVVQIAMMTEAMRLYRQGKVEEAIIGFEKLVALNPRFSDAWNQLALAHESTGHYDRAAAAYKRAIEMTPVLATEFALSLGGILLRLERFDEAEQHARLAEKENPSGAQLLLARVAFARKNFAEAERQARAARSTSTTQLPATVILIQALTQQQRFGEAAQFVAEAEREMAEHKLEAVEMFYFAKGDLLARTGREGEGATAFREEIRLFPRNNSPYSSLAILAVIGGRRDIAHQLMEEMFKASPTRRTAEFAAHTLEQLEDPSGGAVWRKRAQAMP